MTEKEIQDVLDELNTVRPEMLNENAKRLFEAVMKIADERDELQQRVNKATNMIENLIAEFDLYDYITEFDKKIKVPLDILKGNDKNE